MSRAIEPDARADESAARRFIEDAKRCLDAAEMHRRLAEDCAGMAARKSGIAAGLFFRSAELRYDARGGMTEELERRRFEPGARWEHRASVVRRLELLMVAPGGLAWLRVHGTWSAGQSVPCDEMTRANGWLFLGLGQGAQLGRRP